MHVLRRVIGLVLVGLMVGCLVKKTDTFAEQKSIGRVLDELFERKAVALDAENGFWKRSLEVSVELNNVRNLLNKAWMNALTADEIKQLAGAVLRGGSRAIDDFKKSATERVGELLRMEGIIKKTTEAIKTMPTEQQKKYFDLYKSGDASSAAMYLKKHTNLAYDKMYMRQVTSLSQWLDEVAEAVVDNHKLANAVGQELATSSILKSTAINTDDIVADLKIDAKYLGMPNFSGDVSLIFKMIQDISGSDIWSELAYLQVLLRRTDSGKPIYTKLQKYEVNELVNPYEKEFTPPVANYEKTGEFLDKMFSTADSKKASNDKLLERILEEYPSPTGIAYTRKPKLPTFD